MKLKSMNSYDILNTCEFSDAFRASLKMWCAGWESGSPHYMSTPQQELLRRIKALSSIEKLLYNISEDGEHINE